MKSELKRISGRLTTANVDNRSPSQSREATPERQMDRNSRRVQFDVGRRTPDRRSDETQSFYDATNLDYAPLTR